jgi:hypothetical protein
MNIVMVTYGNFDVTALILTAYTEGSTRSRSRSYHEVSKRSLIETKLLKFLPHNVYTSLEVQRATNSVPAMRR